jgi:hypothetical protein
MWRNVDLGVKDAEKSAEPAIVRLQTKSVAAEKPGNEANTASVDGDRKPITGQLSNVFLRLKHIKKAKNGPSDDKIAVV